ncbi:U6 snRNA phosphodiesterase [Teratosphaeria destructans]|uniref:U6 snRNA phosphodiesterase n=1 Tax=Teratosphaeria destructans TaxID=418781 RepID=A0A9W7SY20_9PEZI|nr:U6 snRNA phosphodiesterase [Teratosphaeria destructans]
MGLVTYSDSSSDEDESTRAEPHPAKKRKLGSIIEAKDEQALPALPSSFHDLYSSTVRTSTRDDPSLHGGRKRVTPHVQGNWPTHVSLEWHPAPHEFEALHELLAKQQPDDGKGDSGVKSLLHSELGVPLPLHISLSRPLTLRTELRTAFLDQLKSSIRVSGVKAFTTRVANIRWHPNEMSTRWFLVLGLEKTTGDELPKLLAACNDVAAAFQQPLLYTEGGKEEAAEGKFHISIGWSLDANDRVCGADDRSGVSDAVRDLAIPFSEVKVRIGQDVSVIPLGTARKKALFSA